MTAPGPGAPPDGTADDLAHTSGRRVAGEASTAGRESSERGKATDRTILVGLLLVLSVAAMFRFSSSAVPRMNVDEGWFYYLCRNPMEEVLWYQQKDRFPPLPAVVFKTWMDWGSHDEVRLRLPYAAVATLNVLLVFLLGRCLFDARIGLGAAAVSAVSFPQWEYDTWLRAYGLLTLFTLASTWTYLGVVSRASARRWGWATGYVVCGVLLAYTHYIGVLCLSAHAFVALLRDPQDRWLPRRQRMAWLGGCWLLMLLLFLPWVPMLKLQMERRAQRDLGASAQPLVAVQTLARFLPLETGLENAPLLLHRLFRPGEPQERLDVRIRWMSAVTVSALCLWVIGTGLPRLRRHAMSLRLVAALLAPALLFIVLIAIKMPELSRDRYYVPYIPFVGMLLTAGLVNARARIRPLFLTLAGGILVVNGALLTSYLQSPYFRTADWLTPARFVREHQSHAQVLAAYDNWMAHAFNYYYAGDLLHYDISDLENPRYEFAPAYFARGGLPQYRVWAEEGPQGLERGTRGIDRALLILWYDGPTPGVREWFAQRYGLVAGMNVPNYQVDGRCEVYLVERLGK